MRASELLLAVACAAMLSACSEGASRQGAPVHVAELTSAPFAIDRIYRSMQGPVKHHGFRISEGDPELLWVTGVRMFATDLDGRPHGSDENLCHAELKTAFPEARWRERNRELFGGRRVLQPKWFTLVQGEFDIDFPEGFGIPMFSDEPLATTIMVLNLDPQKAPFEMQVKTELRYVYARELEAPMKALAKTGFNLLARSQHTGDHSGHQGEPGNEQSNQSSPDGHGHSGHHAQGAHAEGGDAASCALDSSDFAVIDDEVLRVAKPVPGADTRELEGEPASAHWFVPPGRHVFKNRYRLAGIHKAEQRIIKVHYIAAHLHVYGVSLELRDATTGETIFTSVAKANERNTGLLDMSHYTSEASEHGLLLNRDHEYDVIAIYDNPTDREIDAMGIVYIYYENTLYRDPKGI